ncbi:Mak10 subunit NatC N(alpha)-terminal acetyltransferase [Lasiodiplodia theobromae]|uniref:Mak10 subunit NatC N(alpha)-terminal acetyltransferase n=1 Tax=Lasiodiplodia theobromae TaxID=45133 RepID=UPI0015C3BE91|nr:Mak10 subunit NatC N(alpha)-terminal acetyltransferase [Lasiodiplodia theobromae]KAF4537274.1 Mak10 subunit NatC N(alpha)-terminal acetyltransferase [Lasiodiplodia theobromae]
MIPGVDHQAPADADDGLAQETARLRLEQEYAALNQEGEVTGVAQAAVQPAPPAAINSRPVPTGNPNAVDITAHFTQACAALSTGQLVKDEYFTLFESVGALEIMDPKMDSGFLAPGETLEEDFDALKELLPEEVIGIMDQLLCYEMSWHQGYPLSQTLTVDEALFHRSSNPREFLKRGSSEDPEGTYRYPGSKSPMLMVLRAYCLGLLKYCDNVIQRVTSRDYFEEEDFSTHTYSRQLLTRFPEEDIIDVIRRAEQWIEHDGKWGKDGELQLHESARQALLSRLALREKLLVVTSPENPLEQQEDDWLAVRQYLQEIQDSHATGTPVKDAFSPKIQRRLASTVPPRPVVELPFTDACQVLLELCQDNLEVVRGTKLQTISPQEIVSYIWEFNSRKPQPLSYSRACLASLVFGNPNEMYEELLRKELEELVMPKDAVLDPVNWSFETSQNPLVPTDKRAIMASLVNDFTNRAVQNYIGVLTSLCQNRCRTRRELCHNLIAFNNLESEIQVLDQELHHLTDDILLYPFASWVYHMKLRQMEWIVQLGFEQEIYLPDERAGMYWWLSSISASRVDLLERILDFVSQRHARFLRTGQKEDAAEVLETQTHVESMLHATKGCSSLAEALCSLYILLHYLKAVPTPSRPFGQPPLRYELRMKPFLMIDTPRLAPFEDFDKDIHPFGPYDAPERPLQEIIYRLTHDVENMVKEAKSEIAMVKKLGAKAAKSEGVKEAWEKNIQNVLLSCISTGLAGATLAKLENAENLPAMVEANSVKMGEAEQSKKYHNWWVVPKVEVVG